MEELLMKDFCLLSGLDEAEAQKWSPLLMACWEEILGKLRPQVEWKLHKERLSLVCASLANYRVQLLEGSTEEKVRVGDISFSCRDEKKIQEELFKMAGDLMDTQGVCIKGVEVC